MLKASFKLTAEVVEAMEEALYEIAPSKWYVIENRITGDGFLEGIFEKEDEVQLAAKALDSISPIKLNLAEGLTLEKIEGKDWKDAYKIHFKPWSVGNFHCIPIWEKESYIIPKGEIGFYLDPGMAFGTGNHETTKLCLEAIVAIKNGKGSKNQNPESFLDLGCGSGIIAITAKLLGYDRVEGIDIDPDAVRIALENATLNSIPDISFHSCSIDGVDRKLPYDVVVANIQTDVLRDFSEKILNLVQSKGILILSGILTEEVNELARHYQNTIKVLGKEAHIETKSLNEWSSITLRYA